jgi:hypothetical protein
LRCKKWDCPECAKKNWKKLYKRIRLSGVDFHRMLTLPFYVGEARSWQEAIAVSGSCLNRFFTSLKRVVPQLRYFWVREIGSESNMVHFHIMVSMYLPQRLLCVLWERAGGGYICHIKPKGMGYSLKYLAKYPDYPQDVRDALKGKRKWSRTRGLLVKLTIWRSDGQWSFVSVPPWKLYGVRVEEYKEGVYYFRLEGG